MLKVGLTGGVACGKSTAGQMFIRRGARLVEADKIAHLLMQPGQAVYDGIVRQFGRDILNPDASINRQKLANAVFGSKRVEELNAIVHPVVIRAQERWMEDVAAHHPEAVAMVEAALILEAGVGKSFDKLVVVTCSPEQKIQRFACRHHLDVEAARVEVERRSQAQLPDEEKARGADYVIDNSGSLEATEERVGRIWTELQRLAKTAAELPASGTGAVP